MATTTDSPSERGGRNLRTWPGIAAAVLIVVGLLVSLFPSAAMPDLAMFGMAGAMIGTFAVFIWWIFFSRARWPERLGVTLLMIGTWVAMRPLLDPSIIGGAMGGLPVFGFTLFALALVVWAAVTQNASTGTRRLAVVIGMLIAAGVCTLVRTAGIHYGFELHWRWTPTPEQLLLAKGSDDPPAVLAEPAPALPPTESVKERPAAKADSDSTVAKMPPASALVSEWPGFRGSDRDGIVHNVRIDTDWAKSPPVERWRRQIGPGWSSFAVAGDLIYTQEQRGDDEIVASYRLSSGQPVWRHRDAVRFWESNAGAGPRGTPTFSNGRIYAFGGTGLLNALDATTGKVVWSRNVASDAETEVPTWGFSSSPLVVDDFVIVAAGGKLAAYDIASGKPRWFGPAGGFSYSSPHLATISGVPQVLLLSGTATSVALSSGMLLWQHKLEGGAIVQPAVTPEGDVLVNTIEPTGGQGIRRLSVAHHSEHWTVNERWASPGLKPYFNDFVVHKGHAFGFDGSILSCIDLADGKRKWKGGRYGSGQLVLLADQDVLLVLSDTGELALVSATPDAFKEIARFKAIEGKTWNHPVLVRDTVLVRNGEEMAAFRLAPLR